MTKNTERVAKAMAEPFEYYNWEATLFKMTLNPSDWEGMQDQLYFDDYDVVCLGSPIVAGYPLTGCPSAVQFIEMLYNALVRAV